MIDSAENKMYNYLYQHYDRDSLQSGNQQVISLLIQVARDWDLHNKQSHSDDWYINKANETIDRFLNNWKDKEPGEDTRGNKVSEAVIQALSSFG